MKNCSNEICMGFFRNFSNPLKLKIILALKEKPGSVGELSKKVGVEQSTLSHALSMLNHCSIVTAKQKGKQRIYFLNKRTILPMLNSFKKHKEECCEK